MYQDVTMPNINRQNSFVFLLLFVFLFLFATSTCLADIDGYDDPTFDQDALRVPKKMKPKNFRFDGQALLAVGRTFETGTGVKKDEDFAIKWYLRVVTANPNLSGREFVIQAAKNGNRAALYARITYMTNFANEKERKNAEFKMLQESADKGFLEAKLELGLDYFSGEVVERDYAKAITYLRESAIQGTVLSGGPLHHTADSNAPEQTHIAFGHLALIYDDEKSGFYNPEQAYYFMLLASRIFNGYFTTDMAKTYIKVLPDRRTFIKQQARQWKIGESYWEAPGL